MSSRQYRRPYARQRRESDAGEEEGFLYCLMYYFDEARRERDETDRRRHRHRRYFDEEELAAARKKEEEEEEDLNPLVYREHLYGRSLRGGVRRSYTPDREGVGRSSASGRSRSHSQPPEINHNDTSGRFRRRK